MCLSVCLETTSHSKYILKEQSPSENQPLSELNATKYNNNIKNDQLKITAGLNHIIYQYTCYMYYI